MSLRDPIFAAVLLLLSGGCGGNSHREIEQTRQTLRSWTSSLDLAAQQRREERVPRLFLPQLLKVANEMLTHERRKIDNAPPAERASLQALAHELEAKIHEQQGRLASKPSK